MPRSAVLVALAVSLCACGSLSRFGLGRRLPALDRETRLANYLEEIWLTRLDRSPETRVRLGEGEDTGRWDDRSESYRAETAQLLRADLARLDLEFDGRGLAPDAQRVCDAFERQTQALLDQHLWSDHAYAVTHVAGPQVDVPRFLAEVQALQDEADAAAYVARLAGAGELFEGAASMSEARRAAGVLAPRAVLAHAQAQCASLLEDEGVWLRDLRARLDGLALASEAQLLSDAEAAIDTSLRPGLITLERTLAAQLELASADLGVWRLPRGRDYYTALVLHRAGPGWTPDDLHALGRREVERLQGELLQVAEEVGFAGSVVNFLAFLRSDPGLAWSAGEDTDDAWLRAAEVTLGAVRSRLQEIVPGPWTAPLLVRATDAPWPGVDGVVGYDAPQASPLAPSAVVVRLDRAVLLPRFLLAAQVHRAGSPGRHLMATRVRSELALPRLLRQGSAPAHEEGWGLYAAALADAQDPEQLPYVRAGRLAQELWCAALLVVDTGLHTRRWERRQAVEYLLRSTCYPEPLCDAAVLHCAALPGHAVSAPVGLFTLRELRRRTERSLGEAFEPRAFHKALLDAGPLPLDLLRAHVQEWARARAR